MKATYDKTMRTQYPCPQCGKMVMTGQCNVLGRTVCDECSGIEESGPAGHGTRQHSTMQWPDDYKRQVDEEARNADQA